LFIVLNIYIVGVTVGFDCNARVPVSLQPDSELVEAFKFFDSNSDNVLTKDEFATMIRSLGKYTHSFGALTLAEEAPLSLVPA